jgi:hypothetical protein
MHSITNILLFALCFVHGVANSDHCRDHIALQKRCLKAFPHKTLAPADVQFLAVKETCCVLDTEMTSNETRVHLPVFCVKRATFLESDTQGTAKRVELLSHNASIVSIALTWREAVSGIQTACGAESNTLKVLEQSDRIMAQADVIGSNISSAVGQLSTDVGAVGDRLKTFQSDTAASFEEQSELIKKQTKAIVDLTNQLEFTTGFLKVQLENAEGRHDKLLEMVNIRGALLDSLYVIGKVVTACFALSMIANQFQHYSTRKFADDKALTADRLDESIVVLARHPKSRTRKMLDEERVTRSGAQFAGQPRYAAN